MGERRERPTKRLENSDLMALAKQSIVADETAEVAQPQVEEDDPLADWEDGHQSPLVAAGSQSNALPTTSRTTTVADPLTTQLLAEVARRTSTMEFDPNELVESERRDTQEIDPEALTAALRDAEKTPLPTAANTKRRTK